MTTKTLYVEFLHLVSQSVRLHGREMQSASNSTIKTLKNVVPKNNVKQIMTSGLPSLIFPEQRSTTSIFSSGEFR